MGAQVPCPHPTQLPPDSKTDQKILTAENFQLANRQLLHPRPRITSSTRSTAQGAVLLPGGGAAGAGGRGGAEEGERGGARGVGGSGCRKKPSPPFVCAETGNSLHFAGWASFRGDCKSFLLHVRFGDFLQTTPFVKSSEAGRWLNQRLSRDVVS